MNGLLNKNGGRFLVPHSQLSNSESNRALEGEIRDAYGRAAYTHKTQEKSADILTERQARFKVCQIILLAISTGGVISVFFGKGEIGAILSSLCSASLLALNLYLKEYDLVEQAQRHKKAANDVLQIRDRYRSLLTDLKIGNKSLETLQETRDDLMVEAHSIYASAPNTGVRAYERARTALKEEEELTFSDEEIDAMLPEDLRKSEDD